MSLRDRDGVVPLTARSRILERIRGALDGRGPVDHPGSLWSANAPPESEDDRLDAFVTALAKGGGEAVRFRDERQASAWLAVFARDFAHAAVSPEVPGSLRPDIPEASSPTAALGVSLALAAAANTGSLLLSSREGRRLQLLPPVHLIWIDPTRVYADLGGALEGVRDEGELPAVLALHSGPSKSADIGRILVTGVHGPGRLIAAIAPCSRHLL